MTITLLVIEYLSFFMNYCTFSPIDPSAKFDLMIKLWEIKIKNIKI